jgi:exonuclease SbcD
LDYVALGHIHKPQNLNENGHPPVIYPGSIERVDFGEVEDNKYYVIAEVTRGKTQVVWHELSHIRPFIDRFVRLESEEKISDTLAGALPPPEVLADAIVRLTLEYPRDWEAMIDDQAIRSQASEALEFHLIKRPQIEARIRLPEDQLLGSLSPIELIQKYWKTSHTDSEEVSALNSLAEAVIHSVDYPADEG